MSEFLEQVQSKRMIIEQNLAESSKKRSIDYLTGSLPIYIGDAPPGTAKSDAKWSIKKLTYSGSNCVDIEWADGNTNEDNVWNDRASLSYS